METAAFSELGAGNKASSGLRPYRLCTCNQLQSPCFEISTFLSPSKNARACLYDTYAVVSMRSVCSAAELNLFPSRKAPQSSKATTTIYFLEPNTDTQSESFLQKQAPLPCTEHLFNLKVYCLLKTIICLASVAMTYSNDKSHALYLHTHTHRERERERAICRGQMRLFLSNRANAGSKDSDNVISSHAFTHATLI